MRSTGLISMTHALAWNLNRGQRNVRLFEIARAYQWKDAHPEETRILTIGATGLASEKGTAQNEKQYTFADLKGDLDQLGQLAGGLAWSPSALPWQDGTQAGAAHAALTNAPLGHAAKIAAPVAAGFKLRQDAFLAELALEPFFAGYQASLAARHYEPLSRFPAVERDFSLLLAEGTSFAAVRDAITNLEIAEVTSVEAVDLFRGKSLPAGRFSLLVRVTLQSRQGTLTDETVNEYSARIVASLQQRLGATLRSV
jgi:phenylalanyl-tRNA synthetase beta chain